MAYPFICKLHYSMSQLDPYIQGLEFVIIPTLF